MENGFYSQNELELLDFKSVGKNVLISKKCSIYGAKNISIGNNVRIDDFCILSGKITIENYVHISAYSALYGKYGIKIGNFCGISPRSIIFSASDDFSGEYMISPMAPEKFTNIKNGEVVLCNFVQLGANTIVMPKIEIKEGAVTGAFSFVNKNLEEWTINLGIPCQFYKNRNDRIKTLSNFVEEEKIG